MSTKITSPLEGHSGRTVFGPLAVEFKDGVAETDEKITGGLKAYLERRGYKVGKGTSGSAHPDGAPSDTWKVDELKAYAAAHEIDLGSATSKSDIVKALTPAVTVPASPVGDDGLDILADPAGQGD